MKKCSECEHGKIVTVRHEGKGSSCNLGVFHREEIKCMHPDNKKWYRTFTGTTRPKSCPLK